MPHVILGLQELGVYSRETFTLISTSDDLSVITVRLDLSRTDPADIESLVQEAGGTVMAVEEERGHSGSGIPIRARQLRSGSGVAANSS